MPLLNIIKDLTAPENNSLVLAVVWISTNIFSIKSRGPTIIGQYAGNRSCYMEHNDIIQPVLMKTSIDPNSRILLEEDKSYDGNKKALYDFFQYLNDEEYFYRLKGSKERAFWFLDSLNSFHYLIDDLKNERNHYYRNGYYCIIYTGRETDRMDALRTIFRRLFQIYVINVNVLLSVGQSVYVYTYFPFTPIRCHNTEPYFHGTFSANTNYEYSREKFFPKKLLNMWQCKLSVTTWNEPPFIDIKYNATTGEVSALAGIEGRLLLLLAERMNFAMKLIEEPNHKAGNGSQSGAIKMLTDGVTNITIAGLIYDNQRQQFAQPSFSYLNAPINFVIPLGATMTPFERLIRPFKYIIWSCLSSSILFGILLIFSLKALCSKTVQNFVFGYGNRIPFTNLLNVLFGGQISGRLPRRNFARYLLGVWIFYTLILRSAYLAQLFLILQDSRARNDLSTVDEVLKRNFTFYTYQIVVPILRGGTTKPLNMKLLDADENILPKLLEILCKKDDTNIAITILQQVVFNYNQENYNNRVDILEEALVNAPITFYMRKHSYLLNEMNELLLNIMSAGLVRRFEELSVENRRSLVERTEEAPALSLDLLFGLFTVHVVLLLLCTMVFLLELWSKYSPLTKKVMNFFNI